jgi:hypothetical protein
MSRGKKVFFSGLALLGLSSFLVYASPADAAITVSSGTAAGVDNLAPGPVGTITVVPDLGVPNVTVTWTLATDDFGRSAPASSDFTSGGVYISVNDVAGYNVWRRPVGGENVLVSTAGPGSASYVDATVAAGLTYIYSVTAIDGSGNASSAVESQQISLGPPPAGGKPTVVSPGSIINKAARLRLGGTLPDSTAQSQFLSDIRATLATLLNVPIDRIIIKGLRAGSIIVDFEITDDPADSADDVAARLQTAVATDPNAFTSVAGAGLVLDVGFSNATSIDFGVAAIDEVIFDTFSFTNTAEDPEAILSVTASTTGAGFSTSVATLSLAAGETGSFDVSFDAAAVGNLNNAYAGALQILTNDPNSRETNVALSASITSGIKLPNIAVSGAFNFGSVFFGSNKSLSLNISNSGDLDLTGSLAVEGDAAFTLDASSFVLAGSQSTNVTVTFAPTVVGAVSGTIVVTSDDADQPEIRVAVSGSGSDPGDLQILLDAAGNRIFGDFDGSAGVTFDDFFIFADNFGQATFEAATDMDVDGDVDFDDFFIFADNFGKTGAYVGSSNFGATIDATQAGTTSTGNGSGTFKLNALKTQFTYNLSVTGLADLTAAHFHNAAAGSTGGVVRDLSFTTADSVTWTASGIWSATEADQPLTSALVTELEAGNIYVNVHTTAVAAGEIRGQVTAQ